MSRLLSARHAAGLVRGVVKEWGRLGAHGRMVARQAKIPGLKSATIWGMSDKASAEWLNSRSVDMVKYLYEVTLKKGRNNPQFEIFFRNVSRLNGKAPDYGGIQNVCIISHHMDAVTVHDLCTDGFRKNENDVIITEITKATMSDDGDHYIYNDLVSRYFRLWCKPLKRGIFAANRPLEQANPYAEHG